MVAEQPRGQDRPLRIHYPCRYRSPNVEKTTQHFPFGLEKQVHDLFYFR